MILQIKKFDTVIAANVLEHALFPEQWGQKAFDLLKEDGVFLASVPFGYDPHDEKSKTYFLFEFLELVLPFGPVEDYGILDAQYAYLKAIKKKRLRRYAAGYARCTRQKRKGVFAEREGDL